MDAVCGLTAVSKSSLNVCFRISTILTEEERQKNGERLGREVESGREGENQEGGCMKEREKREVLNPTPIPTHPPTDKLPLIE